MDKKKKTILLLIVAAAVWGYTGLKWFDYFAVEGDDLMAFNIDDSLIPDLVFEKKQDFVLNASYPDPFLKKKKYRSTTSVSNSNYSPNSHSTQKVAVVTPVKTPFKWPKLKYSGFILSKGEKLGLLNLSGNDILAKKGDVHKQVFIQEIYADSIALKIGENYKTLLKK